MGAASRLGRRGTDARLDSVRWRPPGRSTLIRLLAVTALLVIAAAAAWSQPTGCPPTAPVAAAPSGSAGPMPSVGPVTPSIPPGSVGVPVRLTEPAALRLVHPGDRVDLISVDDHRGSSTTIAPAALVLGVTAPDDPTAGGVLLALTPPQAEQAVATPGHGFAVFLRPG